MHFSRAVCFSEWRGKRNSMSFLKKVLTLLIVFTVFAVNSFSLCTADSSELIFNGDFELLDGEGVPEGWYTDSYDLQPGISLFSVEEETDPLFIHTAVIQNLSLNDSRFAQAVEVEPETLYCLSGYILAETDESGHGANLSVEGVYSFSEEFYHTEGEWRSVSYYGETGPDQYELTVFARLGGYSGESKGIAKFDRISLRKVESLPDGVIADLWYREQNTTYDTEEDTEDLATESNWLKLLLLGILYVFLVLFALAYTRDGQTALLPSQGRIPFRALLACAFLIRVVISYFVTGYMVDVNCFRSWGETMRLYGPAQFYAKTSFCDYPPLYMLVLGLNSFLANLFHASVQWNRVIFRMVPSLCDVLSAFILFRTYRDESESCKPYMKLILLFFAFNPALILNSAAWGQMDSVLCLLLMITVLYAIRKQWRIALPVYVFSVLVKPQALILGVLGLVYLVTEWVRTPASGKKILQSILISVLVLVLALLPFSLNQSPDWIIRLYEQTLGSYSYATINTANMNYLLGGNWQAISLPAHFAAPLILSFLTILLGFCLLRHEKNRVRRCFVFLSAALFFCVFMTLMVIRASWSLIGIVSIAFSVYIVTILAVFRQRPELLSFLGALLFILIYVFGIKMHERYIFPALFLLTLSYVLYRDRRILYLLLLFTFTLFMNEGIVLDNSIRLGSENGHLLQDTVWVADLLSVLNIIGAVFSVILGIELTYGRQPKPFRFPDHILPCKKSMISGAVRSDEKDRDRLHWRKKDTIILLSITLCYSVISLLTLGSTVVPQTTWISTGENEQIVFDLGDHYDQVQILYFAQVSRNDFAFSCSDDLTAWSEETPAEMNQGQCWKWKYVTDSYLNDTGKRVYWNSDLQHIVSFSGRYFRLSALQPNLRLNEVIFRLSDGTVLPATVLSRTGEIPESELLSDPAYLVDEPDTLVGLPRIFVRSQGTGQPDQPSWWNSTYFDEIYHARTAWEFIQGTVPYETSHPPLGKLFMSLCIMVFGMTPFGWRLAGALCGIAMIPAMYLLGKQLTGKTRFAVIASSLIALDCMHLTQTQIATIDSFPVLFIILSFFFMLRFIRLDFRKENYRRSLVNLGFSGLFIGLSIACKWIGLYAGCGLAVLFFYHCIRSVYSSGSYRHESLHLMLRYCLWCVLFFVFIPLMIYILSYIPYMSYNHRIHSLKDYLTAVFDAQTGMLNYHSTKGLGMDHPFYSPWWEWPVIGKPMYYASEQYLDPSLNEHYSIFCFGNPVIWFGSLFTLMICLFRWLSGKRYRLQGNEHLWHLRGYDAQTNWVFLAAGLASQYLPWVLVPRGTYIYHYFASIPFLIVSVILSLDRLPARYDKAVKGIIITFILLAFLSFIIFFPYASGVFAPSEWMDIGSGILKIWY